MASAEMVISNLLFSFDGRTSTSSPSTHTPTGQRGKTPSTVTDTVLPRWPPAGNKALTIGGAARRGAADKESRAAMKPKHGNLKSMVNAYSVAELVRVQILKSHDFSYPKKQARQETSP